MKFILSLIIIFTFSGVYAVALITIENETYIGSIIGKQNSYIYLLQDNNNLVIFNSIDILSINQNGKEIKYLIIKDTDFLIKNMITKEMQIDYYSYKKIKNLNAKELNLYLSLLEQENSTHISQEIKDFRKTYFLTWLASFLGTVILTIVLM